MTINHLNLIVPDVEAATNFFETYFDFTCQQVKGNNVISILKNKENFILVLMSPQKQNGNSTYPDAFHLGFMLNGTNAVTELYEKLKSGGIPVEHEPKIIRDSFGFYFHFDNVMIEIGHYLN
jgi:predicted enzyme related to lactoylglutathione lyase